MRKLIIAAAAIVALLVAALVIAPFLIPLDWVKDKAIAEVEAATGRTLTIGGDVSLSLLPNVQVEVSDVAFSNPEGAADPQMMTLSSLGLDVQLMPLLDGQMVIDRFVLVDPVIRLETDAQGRGNWEFDVPQAADAGTGETTAEETTAGGAGGTLADLRLGDVRIENGTVSMRDGTTGEVTELTAINVSIALPDLASPFTGEGNLVYKGETVNFSGGADSPKALMEGGSSAARIEVESTPVAASFDGEVATGGDLAGQVELKIPSLAALATWLAEPLDATAPMPEAIALSGRLEMAGDRIAFNGAEFTIDAIKARGDLALDMSGQRPFVSAALESEMLDLNPYLATAPAGEAESGSGTTGGETGGGQPDDWSDEEIDFSALDMVDAELSLTLAGLKVQAIEIGRSRLDVLLRDGSATIDLPEAQLYGGGGTAHIALDRSAGRPALATTMAFSGIQAEPLLIAATGFDKLSGTGDLALDVATTGTTQRQFVQALNGDGSFIFRDGAFKGANLAAMAREISMDSLGNAVSGDQKTDFAELSATFVIDNGVVTNNDLFMAAPLVRLDGKGNVNLPPRTLDYSIGLKAVASLEGQGASGEEDGIGLPILVRGPWSDPTIGPDLEAIAKGVLSDPAAVGEQLESLGVDDAGGVGELLENLGGSGGDGESGSDAAADAIKGLFD